MAESFNSISALSPVWRAKRDVQNPPLYNAPWSESHHLLPLNNDGLPMPLRFSNHYHASINFLAEHPNRNTSF